MCFPKSLGRAYFILSYRRMSADELLTTEVIEIDMDFDSEDPQKF